MNKKKDFIIEAMEKLNLNGNEFESLLKSLLTKKQHEIYKLRYDKNGSIKATYIDIAKQLSTSKQNIEQIIKAIHIRIEKYCDKNNIDINQHETKEEFNLKKEKLIETIDENHKIPSKKSKKSTKESIEQYSFYTSIKRKATKVEEKIKKNKTISEEEKMIYEAYNEIQSHLNKITLSKKAELLIETIKEIKRLPRLTAYDRKTPEKLFPDGTNQRLYYDNLVVSIKVIKEKKPHELTHLDEQKLYDYKIIKKEIKKYKPYNTEKKYNHDYSKNIEIMIKKRDELIKTINRLKRKPKEKTKNDNISEAVFYDGTDQQAFYKALHHSVILINQKISNGESLNELDIEKIKCLKTLENVISFYPRKYYHNRLMIKELCESNNINFEKNTRIVAKSYGEVYAKLQFLKDNNIPIVDENDNINDIIFMADLNMQEKYNVSLDELVNKYITGKINGKETVNVLRKLS